MSENRGKSYEGRGGAALAEREPGERASKRDHHRSDVPSRPQESIPEAVLSVGKGAAETQRKIAGLTNRQLNLLFQVALGKSNAQIARESQLSEFTIKNGVSTLMRKLGVESRVELAALACLGHMPSEEELRDRWAILAETVVAIGPERENGEQPPDEGCAHHWVIDSPDGPTSKGVCKLCGSISEFNNSVPQMQWKEAKSEVSWFGRRQNRVRSEPSAVSEY